jgi:hypothetical protein
MTNTIDLKTHHRDFKTPGTFFSVSSRKITPGMNIVDYLKIFYMYTDITQVESMFGNTVFPSQLYGGRSFKLNRSLTERHIRELEELGITLSLTMTGHFFDDDAYNHSREFLRSHHKKGNSVICTNDELAKRIRQDFPDYTLKASIVKQIDTVEKIEQHLEFYDFVVPPMDKNDDDAFLQRIMEKERIILFANANCAYTCPARTCYRGFSQKHMDQSVTSVCSKEKISRLDVGHVYFDIAKFNRMGYRNFKLVPLAPYTAVGAIRYFKDRRNKEGK